MSKLQKAKKPKTKPTQKQKQMKRGAKAPASSIDADKSKAFISHQQMQNVVVNINKPTRARKSRLQKEASPKEKKIPHPPPQFSFSPVITTPSVQSDSSITRHILKTQDAFSNELKKYALANSQADEIEALKYQVAHLKLGTAPSSTPIVYSDLETRGTFHRFVGDGLDAVKIPDDRRLSPLEGLRQKLQAREPALKSQSRFTNPQQAENAAAQADIFDLAGATLKRPEEESRSRILGNLAEQSEIRQSENGGGNLTEAESALIMIKEALGGGGGELPTQQEFRSALHQSSPSIVDVLSRAQEGATAVDLSGESLARSGTQQRATFQLQKGETARQALVKLAKASHIKTTGQYINTAGQKTFGNLPLEVLLARVQDRGVEVPEVIAQAKTKGGRKAKGKA